MGGAECRAVSPPSVTRTLNGRRLPPPPPPTDPRGATLRELDETRVRLGHQGQCPVETPESLRRTRVRGLRTSRAEGVGVGPAGGGAEGRCARGEGGAPAGAGLGEEWVLRGE